MDLNDARQLAHATLLAACPRLAADEDGEAHIFTEPRLSFLGLSPVATIETETLGYVRDARRLYTLPYQLNVYVLALAVTVTDGGLTMNYQQAEDAVCEIVQQAVPALRAAGFEVGPADFTPQKTPWRRVDKALVYRWALIPITFEASYSL